MTVVYPKGNRLAQILIDGFADSSKPEIISFGNPMQLKFEGITYNIYAKCVSWKGNPYPLNDTRAQLPSKPEFEKLKMSNDRFLFLGYDPVCDVVVCWNPVQVKSRLNRSSYVSFYSKKDLQEQAADGRMVSAQLSNGDKFVIFKRMEMASFLSMIEVHFPEFKQIAPLESVDAKTPQKKSEKIELVGIIASVKDDAEIMHLVDSLRPTYSTLRIVAECFNTFGNRYSNMRFQNWANIITSYLESHG